ncbi:hypothetical protein CEXT_617701 [Caerostris extrusa]|uniref:Uncharacterized protein n=1 Tax=Caerostris extrusa TaxID=172846 RepID=A0AAV4PQM4_CAEEX|nr:hypothetical protein CEXT_617701 [Caerostris extrusa]
MFVCYILPFPSNQAPDRLWASSHKFIAAQISKPSLTPTFFPYPNRRQSLDCAKMNQLRVTSTQPAQAETAEEAAIILARARCGFDKTSFTAHSMTIGGPPSNTPPRYTPIFRYAATIQRQP